MELLIWARSSVWESVRFASLWSHIDLRVSAHDFGENFLRNLLKSKNLKICFLLQKTRKKRQYGPIAQLGERSVRIREVEGSNPFGSTISRKITAILAVIFRLTTIIPQTAENPDHFWNPQAVSSSPSPPADFRFMCLPVLSVLPEPRHSISVPWCGPCLFPARYGFYCSRRGAGAGTPPAAFSWD